MWQGSQDAGKKVFHEQLEQLNRGLVAVPVKTGFFKLAAVSGGSIRIL